MLVASSESAGIRVVLGGERVVLAVTQRGLVTCGQTDADRDTDRNRC